MTLRLACLLIAAFTLAACGRPGAPLRPQAGTLIMAPDAEPAKGEVEDKPFVLDPLL